MRKPKINILDFIDISFKGILNRPIDPISLLYFKNRFSKNELTCEGFLRELIDSEEFKYIIKPSMGNINSLNSSPTLFFMHLEKCAGSYLITALSNHYKPWEISYYPNDQLLPHSKFIIGHAPFIYLNEFLERKIMFTILRNPKERIISLYKHSVIINSSILKGCNSFEEWIFSLDKVVLDCIDNLYIRRILQGYVELPDKFDLLTTAEIDVLIIKAIDFYNKFNYVGNKENLNPTKNFLTGILPEINFPDLYINSSNNFQEKITLSENVNKQLERLTYLDEIIYTNFIVKNKSDTV